MKKFHTHGQPGDHSTFAGESKFSHVAKNVFQIAAELSDPVKAAHVSRDELRGIKLKTRGDTHKVLADLYLIAIAFSENPAEYQRFLRDAFFEGYNRPPHADAPLERIMINTVRFGYDATSTGSAEYHAAQRYAKKLSRYARSKLVPEAVIHRLENNGSFDEFGYAEPESSGVKKRDNRHAGPTSNGTAGKKASKRGVDQELDVRLEKKVTLHMSTLRQKRISRRVVGSSFTVLVERVEDGSLCVRRIFFR